MNLPLQIDYDITTPSPQLIYKINDEHDKITYNQHYTEHADDIIKTRFPCGNTDHIPGLTEVFQTMALKLNITPLDEWERRKFVNNHEN